MGEDEKQPAQAVSVEFKVSMHCIACERSVIKALSKVKGVEKVDTDMSNHKAVATGRIKPDKALKKLKKKTGKRVEIVVREEDSEDASSKEADDQEKDMSLEPQMEDDVEQQSMLLTMFSDENPNACSLM